MEGLDSTLPVDQHSFTVIYMTFIPVTSLKEEKDTNNII